MEACVRAGRPIDAVERVGVIMLYKIVNGKNVTRKMFVIIANLSGLPTVPAETDFVRILPIEV
jgi:hypothetical protein